MSNPLPLYIDEATGKPGEPLSDAAMRQLAGLPDLPGADQRANGQNHLGVDARVSQGDLSETGWGVLFAADITDEIKAQLQPLLALRRSQIPKQKPSANPAVKLKPDLYQEFTIPAGTTAYNWIEVFKTDGLTLMAPVRPWLGVPYYLLIVGSPESISFEFQALLKMQWAVGRLYFDDPADYGKYAAAVVAYETVQTLDQTRNIALWMTANGDGATQQLSTVLSGDFLYSDDGALGAGCGFDIDAFVGPGAGADVGAATKANLAEIFRGNLKKGRPALIFTGSHGLKCTLNPNDPTFPARQAQRQGALVTQDYNPASPGDPSGWVFTGDDVPSDARLDGTMIFLFACFSGGCPTGDSYNYNVEGSPVPIATKDFISHLPQVLLSRGALAVIGHIDQAWAYSFAGLDGQSGPQQPQVIGNPLLRLLQGRQAGWAMDELTQLWTIWSAMAQEAQPPAGGGAAAAPDLGGYVQPAAQAGRDPLLVVARNDARNYILLGDPAVKLRVKELNDPGTV